MIRILLSISLAGGVLFLGPAAVSKVAGGLSQNAAGGSSPEIRLAAQEPTVRPSDGAPFAVRLGAEGGAGAAAVAGSAEAVKSGFSFFRPIARLLLRWDMFISRQIPQAMKAVQTSLSLRFVLTALFFGFLYGLIHTFGPGHGKTVVISYFITHKAHFWRGLVMGVHVAVSHVIGAILLVFAVHIALHKIFTTSAAEFFWMRALSYGLIGLIGLFLIGTALGRAFGFRPRGCCAHGEGAAAHKEPAPQGSHAGPSCTPRLAEEHGGRRRSAMEAVLFWAVGTVPCTGSLLILLYALANDILWLGFSMVGMVALGMVVAMALIGSAAILGHQKLLARFLHRQDPRWQIGFEMAGGLIVLLIGGGLLAALLRGSLMVF